MARISCSDAAISSPPTSDAVSAPRTPGAWWRGIPRARRITLVLGAVVLFVAVGAVLARFLSAENVEREDILSVLQAQARGDSARELAVLAQCRPGSACAAAVRASAVSLERPGAVKIVSLKSSSGGSLGGSTGTTRVAWTVIGRLPVVQCVLVRRTGGLFTGVTVTLLTLSAPIENEGDC